MKSEPCAFAAASAARDKIALVVNFGVFLLFSTQNGAAFFTEERPSENPA